MDKEQEEMEQLIISAMTNDGEYQVEDVGEYATEIAKALIFNGYRKLPKVERKRAEFKTAFLPEED